jgi:hypothetical protein
MERRVLNGIVARSAMARRVAGHSREPRVAPNGGRPLALVLAAVALVVAGCGSGIGTPQPIPSASPESGPPSGSPTELPEVSASMGDSPSPVPSPSAVASSSPGGVLMLCANDPSTPPSEIDCRDAVVAAMAAADLASVPIRASLRWSRLCPRTTSCPSQAPDPNLAYVEVDLLDGSGVEVTVRLENGSLVAGAAVALTAADIGSRPTVASPDASKADVGTAPTSVTDRPALPFCGTEKAGLAGPFNATGRRCFLDSVLAGAAAEFASRRSDVGGEPFVELWRFAGTGPVVVLLDQDGRWSELTCALAILPATDQLFDHTDCAVKPIG